MTSPASYAAVDLGAASGRVVVGQVDDRRVLYPAEPVGGEETMGGIGGPHGLEMRFGGTNRHGRQPPRKGPPKRVERSQPPSCHRWIWWSAAAWP